MKLPPYDPYSTYQCIGRIHRFVPKVEVVIIPDPLEMEKRICERLAAKLKEPTLIITDETILVKGQSEILLFPYQAEALGKSLHLDKAKKSDSL
jgi:hypothetical protein